MVCLTWVSWGLGGKQDAILSTWEKSMTAIRVIYFEYTLRSESTFKAIYNIIWFRFNCTTPKNIWLKYYHVIKELFLCLSCRTTILNLTQQLGLTFASATLLDIGAVHNFVHVCVEGERWWKFNKDDLISY